MRVFCKFASILIEVFMNINKTDEYHENIIKHNSEVVKEHINLESTSTKIDGIRLSINTNKELNKKEEGNVINDSKIEFEELILDTDREALKNDLSKVMDEVQNFILNDKSELAEKIRKELEGKRGRDWMVYAPIQGYCVDILDLLASWNKEDWSIEKTAGLLMDIACLTRHSYQDNTPIFSEDLQNVRGDKHKTNVDSPWIKDLNQFGVNPKKGLQCGPSATTGKTLRFLRKILQEQEAKKESIDKNLDLKEKKVVKYEETKAMEAVVNGFILYWKNSLIKRISGQYHTPVEVWAAYSFYLEQHVYKKMSS
jgi:hypothetical protein